MKAFKTLISEYLYETLYEAECLMRSDRLENITKVTDNLRGVCGITVVTVTGPAEPVAEGVEKTSLRVKFFKVEPTMEDQVTRMSIDARKISGVYSFIPVRIKKVINRIYTK